MSMLNQTSNQTVYYERNTIPEMIVRRRKQCLVHRYLYYVCDVNTISDSQYDAWEQELIGLVADFPELAETLPYHDCCPTRFPGSSRATDYPDRIRYDAEFSLQGARDRGVTA